MPHFVVAVQLFAQMPMLLAETETLYRGEAT